MKTSIVVLLVLAACVAPFALAEDEDTPESTADRSTVLAAIEKAKSHAEAEDWDAVIEACQKAIDEAQKIKQGSLTAAFPTAIEGWDVGKLESQRMAMSHGEGSASNAINLSRTYTRKSDGLEVKMTLSNWSIYRQSMQQWLKMKETMPQILAPHGITFFEKGGFTCMKMDPPDGGDSQIVGFGKDRLLMIEADKKDMAGVQTVFDAVKLDAALGEKK